MFKKYFYLSLFVISFSFVFLILPRNFVFAQVCDSSSPFGGGNISCGAGSSACYSLGAQSCYLVPTGNQTAVMCPEQQDIWYQSQTCIPCTINGNPTTPQCTPVGTCANHPSSSNCPPQPAQDCRTYGCPAADGCNSFTCDQRAITVGNYSGYTYACTPHSTGACSGGGSVGGSLCGNNVCDAGETTGTCPQDCPPGVCTAGQDLDLYNGSGGLTATQGNAVTYTINVNNSDHTGDPGNILYKLVAQCPTGAECAWGGQTLMATSTRVYNSITSGTGFETYYYTIKPTFAMAPTNPPFNVAYSFTISVTNNSDPDCTALTSGSLTVNAGTAYPPSVIIDSYNPAYFGGVTQTVNGVAGLNGWAIDNITQVETQIVSAKVYLDNAYLADANYGTPRLDVCNPAGTNPGPNFYGAYPGRANCPNVGWVYSWNTASTTNGVHTIKIEVTDGQAQVNSVSIPVNVQNTVNGACGTANKTYASSASSYGSDTYCASGNASSNPAFPAAGSSSTWTCNGVNGGINSGTCTANHAAAPQPILIYSPTSFSFSTQAGNTAAAQNLTISNDASAGANLTWAVSVTTNTGGAWLTANRNFVGQTQSGTESPGGTATPPISVVANAASLAAGTYTGTITLTSNDPGNASKSIPVTFTVTTGAPTASLSASPTSVAYNASSSLTWTITNATSCTSIGANTMPAATWSTGSASGSISTGAVTANKSYQISCTGPGGSVNSNVVTVTTTVPGAPTATLSASPTSVTSGSSSSITWAIANATSCTSIGTDTLPAATWSSASASGSVSTGSLSATKSYQISCTGPGGTASSNVVSVTVTTVSCNGSGSISRQWWTGIAGTNVASLTSNGSYPNSPSGSDTLSTFETPNNWGDNYGQKVYGYIKPNMTGVYKFYIASDDDSQLWLSTDSTPGNKAKIIDFAGWVPPQTWGTYGSQVSASTTLTAGQTYYIEALHKEGTGGDNLAVGWIIPGASYPPSVIPGACLSPFASAPTATLSASPTSVAAGSSSSITWAIANATSCTSIGTDTLPAGTWSSGSANGSVSTGSISASKSYQISCTGPGGTVSSNIVSVSIIAAPTVTLSANPVDVNYGDPSTLTWTVANATSCTSIGSDTMPTGAWSTGSGGSASTGAITASKTYQLRCTGPGGPADSLAVTVGLVQSPVGPPNVCNTSLCSGTGGTKPGCGILNLYWVDNSNNETGFKIYRDGTYVATASGSSPASATGGTFSYTYTPPDNNPHAYSVSATNGTIESAQFTLTSGGGFAVTACAPVLGGSDKDMTAVNGVAINYSHPTAYSLDGSPLPCDGKTAPLPNTVTLRANDVVTFRINICNDNGYASTTGITVTDSMVNFSAPTAGWNVKYNGLSLGPSNGNSSYTISSNGTNQTLTINLGTNQIGGQNSGGSTRGYITFDAKLTPPSGFTGQSARFQNSFTISSNAPSTSGNTPLLPFYTGGGSSTIIEVP